MNNPSGKKLRPIYLLLVAGLAVVPLILLLAYVSAAYDTTPLSPGPGYRDFSYADPDFLVKAPTGEKAESKLWWNDGYWWGSMYVSATNSFHIHRLQLGTQTWVDTGVQLDDLRDPTVPEMTKADTLWDEANQKLYVVSHVFRKSSSPTLDIFQGRLFRYSYDKTTQTYSLDPEFQGPPYITVNSDKSETLTIDKDSNERLWASYVSRPSGASTDFQVYVNTSSGGGLGNDSDWGTPFTLPAPVPVAASHVVSDDIATLVAVQDHIAVVWTNQTEAVSDTVHLALHNDNSSPASGWTYHSMSLPAGVHIDDHLSAKSVAVTPNGQVFVAVKLQGSSSNDPEIGMYALDTDGTISFHEYSTAQDKDTRPILVIDEAAEKLYLFVSGKEGGSKICYKSLDIPGPGQLDTMGDFDAGDCGVPFIEDNVLIDINNATSMKRNANATTGIVILAADDNNGQYYVHNTMGDPPPVVDATEPQRNMTDVLSTAVIKATFSKEMNAATITTTSFIVHDSSGPVSGNVSYNAALKTATFTPDPPLAANALVTVELTKDIEDTSGQSLNEGIEASDIRETWQFTTTGPKVQFEKPDYSVEEGQQAAITVILESALPQQVTVDYKTVVIPAGDLPADTEQALPGTDYETVSDTLTFAPNVTSQTFNVTTLNNALVDGQKALGLELSNAAGTSLGNPYTATLTIFDDEAPTVSFKNSEYTVNEGNVTAMIEVVLSAQSVTPVTVNFRTEDGSATAGEDYTAVTTQTMTFAPGVTSQNAAVAILDDNLNEVNETINLILDNPSPANTQITNSPATLIILDNDPQPGVQFKSDKYTVDESAGMVTLEVELSAVSGRVVTVKYETGGGTAKPGGDYEPAMGTLTFAKGQTVQNIAVTILDDGGGDSGETFNVVLSDPVGAGPGTPTTAEVTITDEDPIGVYLPAVIGK